MCLLYSLQDNILGYIVRKSGREPESVGITAKKEFLVDEK
jgi:hypothetical protein